MKKMNNWSKVNRKVASEFYSLLGSVNILMSVDLTGREYPVIFYRVMHGSRRGRDKPLFGILWGNLLINDRAIKSRGISLMIYDGPKNGA